MKRLFLLILFWILAVTPAVADCDGFCMYLPVITSENPCNAPAMSDWQIIIPEATTNKVLNSSAEAAGNFAAAAGTTVVNSSAYHHYAIYSYRVETNADNEGIQLTLSALANAIHYATVRVRGTLPASWDWSLDGATFTTPTLLEQIDNDWALYGLQFPAAQANGSTTLYIYQNGAGSGDFYLDGIQVEEKEYWTTYCDGDQEGCQWNGVAFASTSQRSAASRAGGRVRDLEDDYGLNVGGMIGAGAAPQAVGLNSYAILPGGELNNIKIQSRVFTLTGVINGSSMADYHAKRQALRAVLDNNAYPNNQPVRLRYTGAAVHKEIAVYYDGGLDGELAASDPCFWEKVAIRFVAPDPYWYALGESSIFLDTNDTATFTVVAARLRNDEQWNPLGPPSSVSTTFGFDPRVTAITEDGTFFYFGGWYENFDGIANGDQIIRYNKQTGVYSALGTGMDGVIEDLVIAADGTLYAIGQFTTAGGVAANYVASWDGSNWSALGTGLGAAALTAVIGLDGTLYVGGTFTTAGGGAANRVAAWDGSAWSALGTGMNGTVDKLAISPDGTLYAGGQFTTADGGSAIRIAAWDGSAWGALGSGINGTVFALATTKTGLLYAGGTFTSAGGVTVSNVAVWNGTAWGALGSGVNNTVNTLTVGSDDTLYAGGLFTSAGGITLNDRMSRWNGYAWSHLDIDLPAAGYVQSIYTGKSDPVIPQKYDLILGFIGSGTASFAGKATVTNNGTAPAYPKIVFGRTGGTSAVIETLRNEGTGREILFNYSLQSSETLTIDLNPTNRSITSSFFGDRPNPNTVLPNSDLSTWNLLPGANDITSFMAEAGTPTVFGYMIWKDAYSAYD